jgi:soluble lytic murein transglycosylase-like protein
MQTCPSPRPDRRLRGLPPMRRTIAVVFLATTSFLVPTATPFASTAYAQTRPPMVAAVADPFAGFVAEAAGRFGIPASWIRAIMHAESREDPRAVSPKGAMGLMQIMPSTWAILRVRHRLGANPFDPHDNILAGAAFLRELLDRYGSPGFLAAYNAGPGRYEDHLATGRSLPAETKAYVATIAPLIGDGPVDDVVKVASIARSWTEAPLFIGQEISNPTVDQSTHPVQPNPPAKDRRVVDVSALAPQSDSLFVRVSARDPKR